jgi:hypothetical protein
MQSCFSRDIYRGPVYLVFTSDVSAECFTHNSGMLGDLRLVDHSYTWDDLSASRSHRLLFRESVRLVSGVVETWYPHYTMRNTAKQKVTFLTH